MDTCFVWKKLGIVFQPDPTKSWMQTHASLPTAIQLYGSLYRVFFSSRDGDNRSHVGWFDVDLTRPERVERVSELPVLSPGELGTFDDHGVYAACAMRCGEDIYLYTIGWNPGKTPPLFYSSIGLAISKDCGESFKKVGRSPIMARSDHDPCLVTSPFVMKEKERWRMWYVSGYRWDLHKSIPRSHYHIKYAESDDGINWMRNGVVCLGHSNTMEKNIARMCVTVRSGSYEGWYSYDRGHGYEIGYAKSSDGLEWQRCDDQAGLRRSSVGWDSQATAYPYLVKWGGKLFLFYNGNSFGKNGIGVAIADLS